MTTHAPITKDMLPVRARVRQMLRNLVADVLAMIAFGVVLVMLWMSR